MTLGILITNTGTPDAPTASAVRRYLRAFLSDKRIVHLPRFVWLPILYGVILLRRPRRSAALYQKIWTPAGAPMHVIMQRMVALLQKKLDEAYPGHAHVEMGVHYGCPSIQEGLKTLQKKGVERMMLLPLFPQYSNTTTAASFDRFIAGLQTWPAMPAITLIRDYAQHPDYVRALAASVVKHWEQHGRGDHLLISFHGVPERFVKAGDPYQTMCEETAEQLAAALELSPTQWTLCYQSQFGYDKWLKPSTQQLFLTLPAQGMKTVDVICPGFSVDCLETLEEIAIRGQYLFLQAGGEALRYIAALNDTEAHVELLTKIIRCNAS